MFYYYDCDGSHDRWQEAHFATEAEALAWAEARRPRCANHKSVLYNQDFKIIKEWTP